MEPETVAEQKQLKSLLQGSDGIYIKRVLAREPSVGQSSRIYYRKPEGVPFNWEMQPGTPLNRPEEEAIPPLSPPPQVLSLGLPKPSVDYLTDEPDHSKVWFWKKIKIVFKEKKNRAQTSKGSERSLRNDQNMQDKDQSDGDFVASLFSASSSSSSSSTSNSHAIDSSGVSRELVDGGSFCCSPWNISKILDEGSRKVYYCRIHKTAFAVENDGSLVGKILPRVSSVGHSFRSYYRSSDGIPFKWEMQPGTPIDLPDNELIPPPSPPPAVQSLGLTLPNLDDSDEETEKSRNSKIVTIWSWIINKKMQGTEKARGIRCMRLDADATVSGCLDEYRKPVGSTDSIAGAKPCTSSTSSSTSNISVSRSKSIVKVSKFRRDVLGSYFCFNPSNVH